MFKALLSDADVWYLAPVFAIAFIVFTIGIVSDIMKKKIKSQKNGGSSEKKINEKQTSEKSAEDEHDAIMERRMANLKKASGAKNQNAFNARKEVTSVDDTSGNVVVAKDVCDAAKEPVPHKHPAASGKRKVEKKPLSEGEGDEGCAHNNVRFVLDDVMPKDNTDENVKELQRLVVWSEVLMKPKYKK